MTLFLQDFNLTRSMCPDFEGRRSEADDPCIVVGMPLRLFTKDEQAGSAKRNENSSDELAKGEFAVMDSSSPAIAPPHQEIQYDAAIISPSIFRIDPAVTRAMCRWISLFSIKIVHDIDQAVLPSAIAQKKAIKDASALLSQSKIPKWMIIAEFCDEF